MLGLLLEENRCLKLKESKAIMADPQNTSYTERGIEPLLCGTEALPASILSVRLLGLKRRSWDLLEDRVAITWVARCGWRHLYNSGYFCRVLPVVLLSGHGKSVIFHLITRFRKKNGIHQLLQSCPISINSLDWAICPSTLLQEKISGKVTERVKNITELLTQPIFL